MTAKSDILIVGAGIFGVTTALALAGRGYSVKITDPGPLPRPQAASTDISKVVRVEYGADDAYMTLAEESRAGWLRWNEEWPEPLYHEVGLTMLTRRPMLPGSFEYESYHRLQAKGYAVERLTQAEIARRFPAWKAETYQDGYFNPNSGYAESGQVVEQLIKQASRLGVSFHSGQTAAALVERQGRVAGITTREGEQFEARQTIIAAGAWTPLLAPELARQMRVVGQPVFHLKPAEPALFEPPKFTVFSADVSRTGWYGFPLHPRAGVIKITNHGPGQPLHPDAGRDITAKEVNQLRRFLPQTFPALAGAPIAASHFCLYCDTLDGHFWIDHHPERPGLLVAGGGSGHAFKFAPVLGQLVADAVEGQPNPYLERFRWRSLSPDTAIAEETRFSGKV